MKNQNEIQDYEDYLHNEINDWINENNLPMMSLDEIPIELFNEEQLKKRDYYLNKFFNL